MSYSPYGDPNKGTPYKGYKGKGKVQGFNTKVQIKEKTQALIMWKHIFMLQFGSTLSHGLVEEALLMDHRVNVTVLTRKDHDAFARSTISFIQINCDDGSWKELKGNEN